jgi:hypothetical protein
VYDGLIYGALIGALIGFTLLLITAIGKPSRDTAVVQGPTDYVLATVRGWAAANGYRESTDGGALVFQRGTGMLEAASKVTLTPMSYGHQLQACTVMNALVAKRDVAFSDPSFVGSLPRKKRRAEFNQLLAALGHPPVGDATRRQLT